MNQKSSVGLTEELLTNLINMTALEYHFRITFEKYYSLLNVKKVEDQAQRAYLSQKLATTRQLLERTTNQRREVMSLLQSLATEDANADMWCATKHAAVSMITAFEAWQVDLDNEAVANYYHKAVELFNMTVAEFLGFVPQPCSACFADALESQEELNDLVNNIGDKDVAKVISDTEKRAEEVFGGGYESLLGQGQNSENISD